MQEFGTDAKFLTEKGFSVTCIDKSSKAKEYINQQNPNINIITNNFELLDFNELENSDLVYSNLGIVFCNKNYIKTLIEKMKEKVKVNGFFICNFLGIDDEWNDQNHSNIKFFTTNEILQIFNDFKIYYIAEKKYIHDSSNKKDKKWHIIEIYAQKENE